MVTIYTGILDYQAHCLTSQPKNILFRRIGVARCSRSRILTTHHGNEEDQSTSNYSNVNVEKRKAIIRNEHDKKFKSNVAMSNSSAMFIRIQASLQQSFPCIDGIDVPKKTHINLYNMHRHTRLRDTLSHFTTRKIPLQAYCCNVPRILTTHHQRRREHAVISSNYTTLTLT